MLLAAPAIVAPAKPAVRFTQQAGPAEVARREACNGVVGFGRVDGLRGGVGGCGGLVVHRRLVGHSGFEIGHCSNGFEILDGEVGVVRGAGDGVGGVRSGGGGGG